jgi:hypothetical protein
VHCHLIVLDFITVIILGEVYKLESSSLYSLFQLPATFSLIGPNILLSILFSYTLNLSPPLGVRDKVLSPD